MPRYTLLLLCTLVRASHTLQRGGVKPIVPRAADSASAQRGISRFGGGRGFRGGPLDVATLTQPALERNTYRQWVPVITPATIAPRVRTPRLTPFARARLLLLLGSVLWGTYPVVLRLLYLAPGPALPPLFITVARYQILALYGFGLAAFRARQQRRTNALAAPVNTRFAPAAPRGGFVAAAAPAGLAARGAELGLIGLCGNVLSVWGIARTPAVTSEVLLATVHTFVPLLTALLGATAAARHVSRQTWGACSLAFGAAAFSVVCGARARGALGAAAGLCGGGLGGQLALVGAAAAYALGRVRLQHHVRRYGAEQLNLERFRWMARFSLGALAADAARGGPCAGALRALGAVSPMQWGLIAMSVLLSAFLGSLCQFEAQRTLPAASAQPFFSFQPLAAAMWSGLFLSEAIDPSLALGGTVMIFSAILASTDRTVKPVE